MVQSETSYSSEGCIFFSSDVVSQGVFMLQSSFSSHYQICVCTPVECQVVGIEVLPTLL